MLYTVAPSSGTICSRAVSNFPTTVLGSSLTTFVPVSVAAPSGGLLVVWAIAPVAHAREMISVRNKRAIRHSANGLAGRIRQIFSFIFKFGFLYVHNSKFCLA